MIKVASLIDETKLDGIADAWEAEYKGQAFGIKITREMFFAEIKGLIASDKGTVLVITDDNEIVGFMALFIVDKFLGEHRALVERYWYVKPSHRTCGFTLVNQAEMHGASQKCSHILLSASMLASGKYEKVCRFYEHMEYQLFESSFIKEI